MPKKIALLIGVSEYGEGINSLSASLNDVKAMQRVLQDPNLGGFEQVEQLLNPDVIEMQKAIQKLFKEARKDDLVLFFFSGHGITDDEDHLYLTTRITTLGEFEATAVPASFIIKQSNRCYAKRQVLILDACYSGAISEGWRAKSVGVDLKKQLGAEGRVVLTSSTATQISFEQEGSTLSLYTQYLVEGIETGKADKDCDGNIYIHELHDYAKAKVKELRPNMTPDIILDREGFNIIIANAPNNNIYANKLRRYQQEFFNAVKGEYPIIINEYARNTFKQFQQLLGLSDEDVKLVEESILTPIKEAKRQQQKEAEKLQHQQEEAERRRREKQTAQTTTTPTQETDDLSSEKGVDYTRLRDLLKAGFWKEADQETLAVMLKAVNREKAGWLYTDLIKKFPCTDLRTIDQLWVKYSNGQYGFSVQKKIWLEGGENYNAFYTCVGWQIRTEWLFGGWIKEESKKYDSKGPKGHLPLSYNVWSDMKSLDKVCIELLFSRVGLCIL